MKLTYYDTQLLLEILADAKEKCDKDIEAISTDTGAIKLDVPKNYSTRLLRKQGFIESLLKEKDYWVVEI